RIFDEFEQADGTSTRKHGGAGLGLAISRGIVQSMGGTVAVKSRPGIGSEFIIEVPAKSAQPMPSPRDKVLAGRRAVIVSKNLVEARALAETIQAHGGHAEIASTTEQAAKLAEESNTVLVEATLENGGGHMLKRLRRAGFAKAQA